MQNKFWILLDSYTLPIEFDKEAAPGSYTNAFYKENDEEAAPGSYTNAFYKVHLTQLKIIKLASFSRLVLMPVLFKTSTKPNPKS